MKSSQYWDKEYKKGTHWEKGYSKGVEEFARMLPSGSSILDIGCGNGRDCIFLAKKDFDVTGIDISKEALIKAKHLAEKRKLKISFKLINIEKTPYKKESFDGIYSNAALQFTKINAAAKEIYRILKKGGICYLNIILSTTNLETKKTMEKYSAEKVIKAFKKIKILKEHEYDALDKKPFPHIHKTLTLILKK
jgi:ubiquinone/menaquinone biosynthesis C-methylase UbiE